MYFFRSHLGFLFFTNIPEGAIPTFSYFLHLDYFLFSDQVSCILGDYCRSMHGIGLLRVHKERLLRVWEGIKGRTGGVDVFFELIHTLLLLHVERLRPGYTPNSAKRLPFTWSGSVRV